ncbi:MULTISPECIES: Rieske 2Fe-2S domain-containing protein [Prosthecochloris]|uniref:Rieske 2Fe-2S domain-containing protein n=1 Tax=Prosthecochloris vibrioformis TaxID=1098 RepID=A0A5C4S164_PROVB|nr:MULTISPECIES: Rieske 2Fe-2S domain-containing protein [Prosthecochloris]ANT64390.1 Rieske [2Fe-2S] domain protein [Prosthecochloris sp. CIB 2401]TNJ37243.1 Rieske 2Fe-2S domain-containing protein [Prosthecochloris vibrioformis]
MTVKKLDRNFLQRLLGIPATSKPQDAGCWAFRDGIVSLDLAKAGELSAPGGAMRLDGKGLPYPLLVAKSKDGKLHAFKNVCTHGKRALDPVPGTDTVQCCSIGTSTFRYDGTLVEGPAKGPLKVHDVKVNGQSAEIRI